MASHDVVVVIPARYGSTRFPGKPLADIHGKPMIQHVYERGLEAQASRVVVATDDQRIVDAVKSFGGEVCVTSALHESGTERIAEVIDMLSIADPTIVVNVQGDEPFIPAENIRQVARNLQQRPVVHMSTLATPLTDTADIDNPNAVKVVVNTHGHALYFSRASIPFHRDARAADALADNAKVMRRHIGLYAYRAAYVKTYVNYSRSELEGIESLEQLRALWYGDIVHVDEAHEPPPIGIDSPDDLQRLLAMKSTTS
ncbi:3-deoxy-manno-octulosonate cytidylyltransferase [Alteromonas oceanisediminis]|uniref:3-deoxy-manno-octulosonate cytidylyltransferase n=1 Tax=Alteromonas oceanisediminis TaxID=2836180 RepID=UPI001BD9E4D8|nr:3-deoxy-manno-octulosonate cytidylyltransferase [Alteromonas oceanisediminis]MBT0586498.1 3-deoxy-manno-octulosonate cytidylyltransferase [Alteromonas oceanisediminis]